LPFLETEEGLEVAAVEEGEAFGGVGFVENAGKLLNEVGIDGTRGSFESGERRRRGCARACAMPL
jgi:hypothetical protein